MSSPAARGEPRRTWTIGDLAREFGVTTRAIRFYEAEGLLAPWRERGNRVYGARDRVRLKLVLRGKRLGFSLGEIRDLLALYDAPQGERAQLRHFIERMRERRQDLLRQRADIDQVLGELDALEARCEALLEPSRSAAATS